MGPVHKDAALVTERMCWQRARQEARNRHDCYNINKGRGRAQTKTGAERKQALDGCWERRVDSEVQGQHLWSWTWRACGESMRREHAERAGGESRQSQAMVALLNRFHTPSYLEIIFLHTQTLTNKHQSQIEI